MLLKLFVSTHFCHRSIEVVVADASAGRMDVDLGLTSLVVPSSLVQARYPSFPELSFKFIVCTFSRA